jgi:hypothetical protein
MAFDALLLTPFRGACIISNSAYLTIFPRGPHQEHQHYLMSNRSVPNLEERLKHASEAKKLMLAKFKTSLVEGPAAIEKRQQPQAIAAARAEPYPKARGVPRPGTAGSGGAARSLACVDSF